MPDTLLIIDDDRAIAQLTSLFLAGAGYRVMAAYGGKAGIDAAAIHRPRLILLDIRMPDIDGFEVYRRLQQTDMANTPVIFLSANAHEAARREAMSIGARSFLSKPYESKDLLVAVRAALSGGKPLEGKHAA